MRSTALALLTVLTLTFAPVNASALVLLPDSEGFDIDVYAEDGGLAKNAGSHPLSMTFLANFETDDGGLTKGALRNLSLEMPPGLLENPTALGQNYCKASDFATPRNSPFEKSQSGESCPDSTQIGIVTVRSLGGAKERTFGLFNLVPKKGEPAELVSLRHLTREVRRRRQGRGQLQTITEALGA